MSKRRPFATRLKFGTFFLVLAGLFPLSVGTVNYILFRVSIENPELPWLARQFRPASYSLDDIEAFNSELAGDYVLGSQIEYTNVINTGIVILLLALFGLRKGSKRAWWALFFIGSWVGFNALEAELRRDIFPLVVIPLSLGSLGLLITLPILFAPSSSKAK